MTEYNKNDLDIIKNNLCKYAENIHLNKNEISNSHKDIYKQKTGVSLEIPLGIKEDKIGEYIYSQVSNLTGIPVDKLIITPNNIRYDFDYNKLNTIHLEITI